jgi:hypothetical protein
MKKRGDSQKQGSGPAAGSARRLRPDSPDILRRRSDKPHIKIHSSRVILAEGAAEDFVPGAEEAAGMHGVVIMVPDGESGEQLIDMLWRIALVYAGLPSLLYSRAKVQKMVDAIMIRKSRKSPASKTAKGLRP